MRPLPLLALTALMSLACACGSVVYDAEVPSEQYIEPADAGSMHGVVDQPDSAQQVSEDAEPIGAR